MTAVALASLGCKHVQWSMLGKILEWLKANNISVTENADDRLKGLASIFREGSSGSDGFLSYLDGVTSREV